MDRKTLTEGIDVETRLEPGCQDGMVGIIRVPDRIMMTGILIGDVHFLLDQPLTTIFPVQARANPARTEQLENGRDDDHHVYFQNKS